MIGTNQTIPNRSIKTTADYLVIASRVADTIIFVVWLSSVVGTCQ